MATLIAFVGIVVWKIAAIPLTIVAVVVIGMAIYDFWLTAGQNRNGADR
jgi:uncharacterized protein (DUF486 family)